MTQADRTLTLGVMQPYLFPYMGYFQLIAAVDRFVVYDDVNYIKQGWVNRNRILVNGAPHLFTLPLSGAGSFTTMNTIALDPQRYGAWREKFLRTVAQAYVRAPFLRPVQELLRTELVPTSSMYGNQDLSGQARILDICAREGAGRYLNAIGGKELYDGAAFAERGITLSFLRSRLPEYRQGKGSFVPGLSILDAMLFVPPDELHGMMTAFDLE